MEKISKLSKWIMFSLFVFILTSFFKYFDSAIDFKNYIETKDLNELINILLSTLIFALPLILFACLSTGLKYSRKSIVIPHCIVIAYELFSIVYFSKSSTVASTFLSFILVVLLALSVAVTANNRLRESNFFIAIFYLFVLLFVSYLYFDIKVNIANKVSADYMLVNIFYYLSEFAIYSLVLCRNRYQSEIMDI